MGKSRLIQMQLDHIAQHGGITLQLHSQAELQHTPYHPFIAWLSQYAGTQPDPEDRAVQLRLWLQAQGLKLPRHLNVLAELLQPPHEEDTDVALPPVEKLQLIHAALLALIQAIARQRPLLLVLEDLHWADMSTQEWLHACLGHLNLPLLLLFSSRHLLPSWPQLNTLVLKPLSSRQTERLIQLSAGEVGLNRQGQRDILQRCDGVPLYVEEMVHTLQAGFKGDVPASLWHLLAMRLEAVGPAAQLAQQASAIGRDFSTELITALWDGPSDLLHVYLEQLCQLDLIQPEALGSYRFRHALIQDVAYQMLTLPQRKQVHVRLVQLYRGPFRQQLVNQPERLARYLALAGEPQAAAQTWLLAGRMAAGRSAYPEAVFHFEMALDQLRATPAADTLALELNLQAALGNVLVATQGYGAQATRECFARALVLSHQVDDECALFPVIWGLWLGSSSDPGSCHPMEYAEKLERIALASSDAMQKMQAHYARGNSLFRLSRYAEAYAHLEKAVALGRALPVAERLHTYGENVGISALAFISWIDWFQGRPHTAVLNAQAAVADAREQGHVHTLCFALAFAAMLHRFMDQALPAADYAQALQELAQSKNLMLWQAAAVGISGWSQVRLGNAQGLPLIEASVVASRQAMPGVEVTFLTLWIDAVWRLHPAAIRVEQATLAIARSQANQDHFFEPEFLRLRGEALHELADPASKREARKDIQRALEMAAQQGAPTLELRAARSLLSYTSNPAQQRSLQLCIAGILRACPELAAMG